MEHISFRQYTLWMIGSMVVMFALGFAINYFASFNLPSVAGVVSILVPAMISGQTYAKATGEISGPKIAWRFARKATLIQFVVSIILIALLLAVFSPEDFSTADSTNDAPVEFDYAALIAILFGFAIVLMAAVVLPVSRLFFGLGQKSQLKAAEQHAKKKG